MAKHAKNRARPAAIRAYLTAGVTGAAFAGLGAFLAVQDATPATTQYDIKLVSNEEDTLFLSLNGGSDRRDREQRALAAQEVTDANPALRPMFGDGGWLIGNGLDAVEGCEGAACNGGNGGLLGGDGGNGLHGGKGGDAGWWFGNGGHGGGGGPGWAGAWRGWTDSRCRGGGPDVLESAEPGRRGLGFVRCRGRSASRRQCDQSAYERSAGSG